MEPTQTMAVFAAFSAELESLGGGVEGLAGLVAGYARHASAETRPEVLVQAQALDELTQRLDALSALAVALARGESIEAGLDRMPLADLANRIRGIVLRSRPENRSRAVAGDLMLFD
ncbi:hypothetical protein [Brevundimonas sp.]|uniref:hypothetical protein n=1 Tax=Brevundimonas sp. TaxID=1871086 RepID=UPI002730DE4D|nr:hypothetical protein [Brevundimonas sp.]MDP1912915.1 hypothetical protein [Brevundimonas sp.]